MTAILTRYRVKADRLDEHQRLIDAIFAELEATKVDGFTFKVFRFDDDRTYQHVVIAYDVDAPARLEDMPTYRDFAIRWNERCDEPPRPHAASVVGGWR